MESKLAILVKEKETSDIDANGPANKKTVTDDKENKCLLGMMGRNVVALVGVKMELACIL